MTQWAINSDFTVQGLHTVINRCFNMDYQILVTHVTWIQFFSVYMHVRLLGKKYYLIKGLIWLIRIFSGLIKVEKLLNKGRLKRSLWFRFCRKYLGWFQKKHRLLIANVNWQNCSIICRNIFQVNKFVNIKCKTHFIFFSKFSYFSMKKMNKFMNFLNSMHFWLVRLTDVPNIARNNVYPSIT